MTLSNEGFSTEAQYTASPRVEVPGKTTRGFIPGPIKPGKWAAELGVAAVIPQSEGDADGKVDWRVEIDLADDPAFADEPYRPARYDTKPARARAAAGTRATSTCTPSTPATANATMSEVFGYAFKPIADGGAGLDFLTLSDYVSGYPAWNEIGRYQAQYRGKLVVRSAEVITYRGHTNNHGSADFVDYRTVPIYERLPNGSLTLQSAGRLPSDIFKEVHRYGGWTQINHPTIFPPVNPAAAAFCRGCFWEYTDADTDYSQVDSIEIATGVSELGNGPNPFTVTAIAAYERLLGLGYRIAAVGSSDSHLAGRAPGVLDAPVGEATTVVYAPELSEDGIRCGVQADHTYVKVTGNAGPDLRFHARPWGHTSQRANIGDLLRAPGANFRVRVLNGAGRDLQVVKDGTTAATVPITSADFRYRFQGTGTGRWRLQIMRGNFIDTVSSPIWLKPGTTGLERTRCRGVPGKDW